MSKEALPLRLVLLLLSLSPAVYMCVNSSYYSVSVANNVVHPILLILPPIIIFTLKFCKHVYMHRLSTIIAFIQLSYLKILLFELTETHTDIITYHLPRIKRLWSYDELINYAQEVSHSKNLQYSPLDLDNIVKFSQGSKEKLNEAIVNDYLSSLANKSSPASNYAGEALTAVSSNFTVIASVIVLFAISATATMALFYTYSWLFPVGL